MDNSNFYQEFYKFLNEVYQDQTNLNSKFPLETKKIYIHLQGHLHLTMGNEQLFEVH